MANPAISARLKYLNDSAHLLVASAPGTSAYLMSRCNRLMFDCDLSQTDAQRRHVCGACGNIMILGWTSTRKIDAARARKGKQVATSSEKLKAVVYTCELCSRHTRQNINTTIPRASGSGKTMPRPKVLQVATSVKAFSSATNPATKTPSSMSANASSKKRAKIRKQSGLQALLAKQKETDTRASSGGFGLDLLDLMKKA